jgi:hypothetical protein
MPTVEIRDLAVYEACAQAGGVGMTTPAQLERLQEHCQHLRLFMSRERLEALLQKRPTATSSKRCSPRR